MHAIFEYGCTWRILFANGMFGTMVGYTGCQGVLSMGVPNLLKCRGRRFSARGQRQQQETLLDVRRTYSEHDASSAIHFFVFVMLGWAMYECDVYICVFL